jgi:hypothetical protein
VNAELESNGAETLVHFKAPGEYLVHAYGTSGTGSATVKVINATRLPEGAEKWAVDDLPGCKAGKIVPAIPAAGSTNDLFYTQLCPQGTVVRAFTAEGLENWRTGVPPDQEVNANNLQLFEPKSLSRASVCDKLKVGMTKDETTMIVETAKAKLSSHKNANVWVLEEYGGECRVTFAEDMLTKKQRVISN